MKKSLIISIAVASLLLAGCGANDTKKEEVTKVAVQVEVQEEATVDLALVNKGFLKAAKKGNLVKFNEYLEQGADINAVDKKGNTAIMLALSKKKIKMDVVKAIMALNPDVTITNKFKKEPIMIAKTADIAEMLIAAGVDPNKILTNKLPLIVYAAQKLPAEVVEVIIKNGADLEVLGTKGYTALMWAAFDNKVDTANVLIDGGAKTETVDLTGNTALMWAAAPEVTNLLLDAGANVNAVNNDGLIIGQETLMLAIEDGNSELVKKVSDLGIDLNFIDSYNNSPLMLATKKMNNDVVKMLISLGADTKLANKDGKIALDFAGANVELLEILK